MKRAELIILAGLLLPSVAIAQTDRSDLERENAELRARVKAMEARLEALEARLLVTEERLREQGARLGQLSAGRAPREGAPKRRARADRPMPPRERPPEGPDIRRYRELKRELAAVIAQHGKEHARARELKDTAVDVLNGIAERLGKELEELSRRRHRELEEQLAALHAEVVGEEHDAERQLAASGMALKQAIDEHGKDSVDAERLQNRHAELQRQIDQRMRAISGKARVARKQGEGRLARELAQAERDVRLRLKQLASWSPGKRRVKEPDEKGKESPDGTDGGAGMSPEEESPPGAGSAD